MTILHLGTETRESLDAMRGSLALILLDMLPTQRIHLTLALHGACIGLWSEKFGIPLPTGTSGARK